MNFQLFLSNFIFFKLTYQFKNSTDQWSVIIGISLLINLIKNWSYYKKYWSIKYKPFLLNLSIKSIVITFHQKWLIKLVLIRVSIFGTIFLILFYGWNTDFSKVFLKWWMCKILKSLKMLVKEVASEIYLKINVKYNSKSILVSFVQLPHKN